MYSISRDLPLYLAQLFPEAVDLISEEVTPEAAMISVMLPYFDESKRRRAHDLLSARTEDLRIELGSFSPVYVRTRTGKHVVNPLQTMLSLWVPTPHFVVPQIMNVCEFRAWVRWKKPEADALVRHLRSMVVDSNTCDLDIWPYLMEQFENHKRRRGLGNSRSAFVRSVWSKASDKNLKQIVAARLDIGHASHTLTTLDHARSILAVCGFDFSYAVPWSEE